MTKTRDLADLGGGFIQAGSGAVQRTVESKLQDVVSVKDFGAVGDGVADDTAAIQAAIDYAASVTTNTGLVGSAGVYFPPGRYNVSATLILPDQKQITLIGSGNRSSVIWANSGTYTDSYLFKFSVLGSTTFGVGVKDLGFRRSTTASETLSFAELNDLGSANFDNLWISGFYNVFVFEGCSRCFFTKISADAAGRTTKANSVWKFIEGNTGIHITDCEVTSQNSTLAGTPSAVVGEAFTSNASWNYIIVNEEVDSLYFNNCHWIDYDFGYYCDIKSNHNTGTIIFTQCYWDEYRVNCVKFANNINQLNYDINTHRWVQCYLRGGNDTVASARTVNADTTQEIDLLQFTGCVFKGSSDAAIFIRNSLSQVLNLQVTGCYFESNNTYSVSTVANNIDGWAKSVVITGNIFNNATTNFSTGSGSTNGYSVNIRAGSGYSYNVCNNHSTVPAASNYTAGSSESFMDVNGGGAASSTNSGNISANNTWTVL